MAKRPFRRDPQLAKPRGRGPSVLVMVREISDSVQVAGLKTVAAAFGLDPSTGLILGSGVASDPHAALVDLLVNVSSASTHKASRSARILCSPEVAKVVRGCLPDVWRTAEIVPVQPDVAVEDLFDSLVGHLAGRLQPTDMPSPEDWSMLFRQARAFVEAAPWRRLADDVHLHMDLRISSNSSHRVGIVLGHAGLTYGFAVYPGDAEPPGGPTHIYPTAPPPGTLVMTLDPASALPAYLVAKARRYEWPEALALLPVFFAWTADGAADPSSDEVALLTIALAAALAGDAQQRETRTAGDMILNGGRSAQYQVEVTRKPVAHPPRSNARGGLTIDRALHAFVEESRSRLSTRTAGTYESVIDLLRGCLNSYGYQSLSDAEHDEFQTAYEAGDEQAFCNLFGAEKIIESIGEFLGYFMIRKVAASEELLRASGTVVGKLATWLAERGVVSPEAAHEAQRRARAAARDLPRAARLAEILFAAAESGPSVNVDRLRETDYIEDQLTISRVEPGRVWFEDDIGPVKVPKTASDLARAGWTVSLALGRVRGEWRIVQVGNVYP